MILVASMLVSPIMGPILAIVFGTRIKNKKLVKIGIYREMYSLLICIICGFIFGCLFVVKFNRLEFLIVEIVDNNNIMIFSRTRNVLAVTSLTWPSPEMASRTGWSCLVVGLAIAIPSGVGVAISVLGGNAGSMVGVAISASLLPPAVNTGLYWAMALISYGVDDTNAYKNDLTKDGEIVVDNEVGHNFYLFYMKFQIHFRHSSLSMQNMGIFLRNFFFVVPSVSPSPWSILSALSLLVSSYSSSKRYLLKVSPRGMLLSGRRT